MTAHATVGPFRVREIVYPPGYRQPVHAHPGASLTLILSGALRETAGRREETASALSVVAKLPGVAHADAFGPEPARTLQVAFDPDDLAADDVAVPELPPWRWLHDGTAARPLLQLWRGLNGAGGKAEAEAEDAVVDGLAAVVASGRHGDGATAGSGGSVPDWLDRAREALDDTLPARISVRRLAELSGVHPVSLSRAFRRHFGCTITEYRRHRRVGRAATLLSDTRRDVTGIAYAAGFADHPHLCRSFRAATGLTPTEFRRLARES